MLQSIGEVWLVTAGFGEGLDSMMIPGAYQWDSVPVAVGLKSMCAGISTSVDGPGALTHGLTIFKATTGLASSFHPLLFLTPCWVVPLLYPFYYLVT